MNVKKETLIFVDDVERAGWLAVYANSQAHSSNMACMAADHAIKLARERQARDLQAENAELCQDLAEAHASIDRLHDTIALLHDTYAQRPRTP